MNIYLIFYVIFAHYICDGLLQPRSLATTKSVSIKSLLKHTVSYSTFMTTLLMLVLYFVDIPFQENESYIYIIFFLVTFMAHTATDYITSKIVHNQYKNGKYGTEFPNVGMFTTIMFDQLLHYIQLFLTLNYLIT